MKICNQCQAAMDDELESCLICGASLSDVESVAEEELEIQAEEAAEELQEETAEETVEESAEEAAEETAEEPAPKKKNRTGLIVGLILAAVVLVAVILVKGGKSAENVPETPATVETPEEMPAETPEQILGVPGLHTNAYGYESYSVHYELAEDGTATYSLMNEAGELVSVKAEDVEAKLSDVVATCGEMELTNQTLAYYYYQQLLNLQNTYGDMLPYLMDTTIGYDEQMSLNQEQTWQQFLVSTSITQFQQIAALCQAAEAEGWALSEEDRAYLEANTDFDAMAAAYGLADGNALLEAQFGPGATVESYKAFMETVLTGTTYVSEMYETVEATKQEISDYYDANADMMLTSYGIEKIEKNVVNVRHILIQPEAAEDGSISEEAWTAAEEEAQRIYDEWLAGEATEDAFAELAGTYTQDPGSQTTGGLYEEVYPGQMITEFNDWCFADGRQVGDHGIVKTTYGYHIMFFSGEGDYAYWELAAEELCRQEKLMAMIEEITAGYAPTMDLTKAMMLEYLAPTAPAVEEEAAAE